MILWIICDIYLLLVHWILDLIDNSIIIDHVFTQLCYTLRNLEREISFGKRRFYFYYSSICNGSLTTVDRVSEGKE